MITKTVFMSISCGFMQAKLEFSLYAEAARIARGILARPHPVFLILAREKDMKIFLTGSEGIVGKYFSIDGQRPCEPSTEYGIGKLLGE